MIPYPRPSYAQLLARIGADLALLPAALRDGLAGAWARACDGEHGHLEWVDAQCSPLTCEEDRLYDWADLYGTPRLAATAALGWVTASGSPGAQILAGSVLRGANGLDYTVGRSRYAEEWAAGGLKVYHNGPPPSFEGFFMMKREVLR